MLSELFIERTHRVEMDVVDHSRKVRTRFNQQCLVSPLEDVAPFASKTVEAVRKSRLQPVHAIDQVWLWSLQF